MAADLKSLVVHDACPVACKKKSEGWCTSKCGVNAAPTQTAGNCVCKNTTNATHTCSWKARLRKSSCPGGRPVALCDEDDHPILVLQSQCTT